MAKNLQNYSTFNGLTVEYIMGNIVESKANCAVNQIVPELKLNLGMGKEFYRVSGKPLED